MTEKTSPSESPLNARTDATSLSGASTRGASESTVDPTPDDIGADRSADVTADVTADANPRLAARLFVLPGIIGSVIVLALALYFGVRVLTRETRSADAYLEDVRISAGNRRWQAAYELSRLLESGEARIGKGTADRALVVFQEARANSEDPRVRRYLALALGRLRDPAAVAALSKALADPDPETRIYSALALGQIGDRRATPALAGAMADEDPGVRKSAGYALGSLGDPAGAEPLRGALHDGTVDVTWNAAVALARLGDPSGAEVLRSMADREFVERASQSADPASRSSVIVTGVQGLVMIDDTQSLPALRKLASSDPDLRVREAAIEGLKKLEAVLTSQGPRVQ